jgi:hypothetical protein
VPVEAKRGSIRLSGALSEEFIGTRSRRTASIVFASALDEGSPTSPDRGEKPMLMHPYVASQLAREHSRQMRADASQRQLRHQQGYREARKANAEAVSGTPSVTALVASARNGDKRAWDELFERYAPLIWSICRRYRLSQMDADDVGQNVWLQLVGHLAAIRDPAALPGWLATTTAGNVAGSCVRHSNSRLRTTGRTTQG